MIKILLGFLLISLSSNAEISTVSRGEGITAQKMNELIENSNKLDWFVDVSMGGSNPGLGGSSLSVLTPINGSLDIVVNSGSADVEIACSNAESEGLNCSGTESLGISFDIDSPGRYKACISFSHIGQADAGGQIYSTFQLVETANDSFIVLQEGKSKAHSSPDPNASLPLHAVLPINLCSQFNFATAGKKTIRLMYEQFTTANVNQNSVYADRSTTYGKRDIHFTVNRVN